MNGKWLVLVLALLPARPAVADDSRDLFNGKDLDGWVVEGSREYTKGGKKFPVWVVQDGLLCCTVEQSSFGFLRYAKQEFSDFALHVEYRMAAPNKGRRGNSGVGIRTVPYETKSPLKTRPSFAAYEVQLLDDAGAKPTKHSTASLYRYVAPKVNAVKAAPAWNVLDVECVGPRIRIRLNGKEVLDVDQTTVKEIKDKPLKGFVCLQNHGSRVEFRSVRVREIRPKKQGGDQP
jgi:hypothetical protein